MNKDTERPTVGRISIEGGFDMEQEIDYTLLGQRLEDFINAVVPDWFITWFKKDGCNCDLRKELLNNWHLDYREYKQAVKANKKDNYQIAKAKLDRLK